MNERPLSRMSIDPISRLTGRSSNRTLLREAAFRNAMSGEVLRSERSGNSLLLALLHFDGLQWSDRHGRLTKAVCESIGSVIRATDTIGWYKQNNTMGVLFPDLREPAKGGLLDSIDAKLQKVLSTTVPVESGQPPHLTYHIFPDVDQASGVGDPVLAPECVPDPRTVAGILKRCVDIVGSVLLLFAFFPPAGSCRLSDQAYFSRSRVLPANPDRSGRPNLYFTEVPLHVRELRRQPAPRLRHPHDCRSAGAAGA